MEVPKSMVRFGGFVGGAEHELRSGRREGLLLNVINFNTAMLDCENRGQWQRWRKAGLLPNGINFNMDFSACEMGGQWQLWRREVPVLS
eukprot:7526070-Karenia_brevis.AAC.1